MNVEMLSRMGHKRYLEEIANDHLDRPIFLEEMYVAPSRQGPWKFGRVGLVLLKLQLGLVLVALAVLGYSVMFDFPVWVQWAYTASIVVGVAGLVAGLRELSRAYPRGYNFARMSLEGKLPESPTGVVHQGDEVLPDVDVP
jgi:hypothetical protein